MNRKITKIRDDVTSCGVKMALGSISAEKIGDKRLRDILIDIQTKCHEACVYIDSRSEGPG